jgi:hypothetical protein
MKKINDIEEDYMRTEYDFADGVRGKHYKAMQAGYTITIYKADGTTVDSGCDASIRRGYFRARCTFLFSKF